MKVNHWLEFKVLGIISFVWKGRDEEAPLRKESPPFCAAFRGPIQAWETATLSNKGQQETTFCLCSLIIY